MDKLILFLILERMLSVFHHKYDVSCGFFIDAFYQIDEGLFYSCLLRGFLRNGCWILTNAIFCVYYHIGFFSFFLVCKYNELK